MSKHKVARRGFLAGAALGAGVAAGARLLPEADAQTHLPPAAAKALPVMALWIKSHGIATTPPARLILSERRGLTATHSMTRWATSGNGYRIGTALNTTRIARKPIPRARRPANTAWPGVVPGVARGPARVSSRYVLRPNVRSIVVGFRCVRVAAQ